MRTRLLKILPALILLGIMMANPSGTSLAADIDSASYWIKRIEAPDAVVLTDAEIQELNKLVLEKTDQMADISGMPPGVSREQLLAWILYDPMPENIDRYDSHGKKIKKHFFSELSRNMNLEDVKESNGVRFGVAVKRADIRAFPTDEPSLKKPGADDFDTFQYSGIYPPEPVALLHKSRDQQWGFFQTGTVRGWIRLDKVAFADAGMPEDAGKPLVVTGSLVNVYGDRNLRKLLARLPMGQALSLKKEKEGSAPWVVRFPQKVNDGVSWVDGYIDGRADVNIGFLPYTKRNVLTQAFKMAGEKYGWGGKGGRRDCSEFIKDIFASMGVKLPRNSQQQASVGVTMARVEDIPKKEELQAALKNAEPAITLVGLDRHIMLYIGERAGKPYVIHQFYGYSAGRKFKVVNRVAVTGLNLGARFKEGLFKSRIRSVTEVLMPEKKAAPEKPA